MKTVGFVFWCAVAVMVITSFPAAARTCECKVYKTKGSSSGNNRGWGDPKNESKRMFAKIKIGGASKIDDKSEMEIRAATVLKNVETKQTGVNDITTLRFEPINTGKPIYFMVETGVARSSKETYWVDVKRGWQLAGYIVELWQGGRPVKHWSNVSGAGGKTKLTGDVKPLLVNTKGYEQRENSYDPFDNQTEVFAVNEKDEKVDIDEVLKQFRDTQEEKPEDGPATAVDQEEFRMKSFCGYEFGAKKPEFSQQVEELKKPFFHYTVARPRYGATLGRLMSLRIESRNHGQEQEDRNTAVLKAVAAIEKQYGITMRSESYGDGTSYHFSNEHVHIFVCPWNIEISDRKLVREEERATRQKLKELKKDIQAADEAS